MDFVLEQLFEPRLHVLAERLLDEVGELGFVRGEVDAGRGLVLGELGEGCVDVGLELGVGGQLVLEREGLVSFEKGQSIMCSSTFLQKFIKCLRNPGGSGKKNLYINPI